jgi:hypothetical protein
MTAALIFAANHSDEQASGDWIWLVVAVLVFLLIAAGIFTVFAKSTSRSHGGVEHPDDDGRTGNPPFESIERRS